MEFVEEPGSEFGEGCGFVGEGGGVREGGCCVGVGIGVVVLGEGLWMGVRMGMSVVG